jgi:outer membrane lipoprotein-sorting protein
MKRFRRIIFALIVTVLFSMNAEAADRTFKEADVEYSADEQMETEDMAMEAKIFHAQGKERREQEMGGMQQIMIMRTDRGVVWMLMPEQKMYMEMKMGQGEDNSADLKDYTIEYSVVGEEVVNGINTTKNKVIVTDKKGNKFGGFMWVAMEGIMVKMDTVSKVEGSKMRVKMERRNIKIGKQDPKIFEIPAGYNKMSMPGMGGFNMQDMMKGME